MDYFRCEKCGEHEERDLAYIINSKTYCEKCASEILEKKE